MHHAKVEMKLIIGIKRSISIYQSPRPLVLGFIPTEETLVRIIEAKWVAPWYKPKQTHPGTSSGIKSNAVYKLQAQ